MIQVESDLLLVGCGKMGGALLDGWIDDGLPPSRVTIVEPFEELHKDLEARGCSCVSGPEKLPPDYAPGLILLAVKPQMMEAVLPSYRRFVAPGCIFLSIAAGTKIARFEAALGEDAVVVRVMPNTPAAVGRGMSVLVANAGASEPQKELCEALMAAVGETAWVEDEASLDAVTALSGSGPAYVFHMVECMAAAGRKAGLESDLAMQLARATVTGAGELMFRSPESAERLRRNVTSPGGTTEAALKVLMGGQALEELMTRAVEAARKRGAELGG